MEKNLIIKKLCGALNDNRGTIFAGAGLSVSAVFVDWKGLLETLPWFQAL